MEYETPFYRRKGFVDAGGTYHVDAWLTDHEGIDLVTSDRLEALFAASPGSTVTDFKRDEYVDPNCRVQHGVWETTDPDYCLILTRKANDIFAGRSDFTFEDAKERFGEAIIRQYLEEQNRIHEENKKTRTTNAKAVLQTKASKREPMIVARILMGYSKEDVAKLLNISESTIERVFRRMRQRELSIYTMFADEANEEIFLEVNRSTVDAFVACNYSYKAFRKWLKDHQF